jgi:hypothetical protein
MIKSVNYSVTVYSTQERMYNYTISVYEENYIETLKEALSKNKIIELPQSDGKTTILLNTKNIAMIKIEKTSENEE